MKKSILMPIIVCTLTVVTLHPASRYRGGRQQRSMAMTPDERAEYQQRRADETQRRSKGRGFKPDLTSPEGVRLLEKDPEQWAREFITVYELPDWGKKYSKQQIDAFVQEILNYFNSLNTLSAIAEARTALDNLNLPPRIKTNFKKRFEPLLDLMERTTRSSTTEPEEAATEEFSDMPPLVTIPEASTEPETTERELKELTFEETSTPIRSTAPSKEDKMDLYKQLLTPDDISKAKLVETHTESRLVNFAVALSISKMEEGIKNQNEEIIEDAREEIWKKGRPDKEYSDLKDKYPSIVDQNKILRSIIDKYVTNYKLPPVKPEVTASSAAGSETTEKRGEVLRAGRKRIAAFEKEEQASIAEALAAGRTETEKPKAAATEIEQYMQLLQNYDLDKFNKFIITVYERGKSFTDSEKAANLKASQIAAALIEMNDAATPGIKEARQIIWQMRPDPSTSTLALDRAYDTIEGQNNALKKIIDQLLINNSLYKSL